MSHQNNQKRVNSDSKKRQQRAKKPSFGQGIVQPSEAHQLDLSIQ